MVVKLSEERIQYSIASDKWLKIKTSPGDFCAWIVLKNSHYISGCRTLLNVKTKTVKSLMIHINHLDLHVEMQLMCNIEERCVAGKADPDVPYTDVIVTQEVQPRRFGGKQKLTRVDCSTQSPE